MKYAAAIVALASVAVATPTSYPPPPSCKAGTYQCSGWNTWQVCNTSNQWVYAGTCPPNTYCKFYPTNGSPYCIPPGFQIP